MAKAIDDAPGAVSTPKETVGDLASIEGFVIVVVPKKAYDVIEQHAQSKKMSVSEVVAKAFAEYIQRNS